MTIASEINRIKLNIKNAYDSLADKGATIPAIKNTNNLASTIDTLDFNDRANVITAINYTGTELQKGTKVWISTKNPSTNVEDGYYIVNFVSAIDPSCYSAVTSDVCGILESVDVFTVLDSNTMTIASNDDFVYDIIP